MYSVINQMNKVVFTSKCKSAANIIKSGLNSSNDNIDELGNQVSYYHVKYNK